MRLPFHRACLLIGIVTLGIPNFYGCFTPPAIAPVNRDSTDPFPKVSFGDPDYRLTERIIYDVIFKPNDAVQICDKKRESEVRVEKLHPTKVMFPSIIVGGWKKREGALQVEKSGMTVTIRSVRQLPPEGETVIAHDDRGRAYSLLVKSADKKHPQDKIVKVVTSSRPLHAFCYLSR